MKKKQSPLLHNNLYILKLVWSICPTRLILTFLTSLMDFAMWAFYTVFFMRFLFGAEETRTFQEAMWFVWIVVAVNLVYHYFHSWYQHTYVPKSDIRIRYEMNIVLFEKARSVDISCFESPDFYDSYTRATTEAYDRAISVMNTCATAVSALLASVYVIYAMISITIFAAPFILLPLVGNLYFGKIISKLYYEYDRDNVPFRRRQDYVNRALFLRKFAGEVRLTGILDILKQTYDDSVSGINHTVDKFSKRLYINHIIRLFFIFPLPFQGLWLLGAFLAIEQHISLGDFIVLSGAIVSITHMVRSFSDSIIQSFANANYINNLLSFLDYEPKIREDQTGILPDATITEIQFRDVTFRYEGQDRAALEHISLTLNSGSKNALVGINGSGKTTFIKLLMRYYDPTDGEILLNGIDIRQYDLCAYRDLIGTAFQDFALFSATVAENVLLQEITEEQKTEDVGRALQDSGIYEKIQSLANQENTILTREFDTNGVELSGGEKQKIAIARAFAKKSPIVILDEPTSALDPIAEYDMYQSIIRLFEEDDHAKIGIIVSHRLSSAVMCDMIFVFQDGHLIENGTHTELLAVTGVYANMFHKQAESYLQSEKENKYAK